jgi:hypothetical protein
MYWLINVPLVSLNLGDADLPSSTRSACPTSSRPAGFGLLPARIATQRLGASSERMAVGDCGCCLDRLRRVAPARR